MHWRQLARKKSIGKLNNSAKTSWHNIAAVKALTRYYIWWVNCERDIEMFVENCYPYQENRENE
ncbi:hypothetical protein T01_11947 [Trichinella spiralis]|uniref:Integrase zinc-binding domain-containing protein n=1 Tax=Trichinella spiralis TaxID=6334 RepID=A0A0V0ZBS8_TRISP|nr:hypothetical protein T01_11947 [Trichinella spiralis]